MKLSVKYLENLIKKNAYQYYMGHPLITDDEFDELTFKLKDLDPDNPLFKSVGWGFDVNNETNSLPHMFNLAKFEGKIYDPNDINVPMNDRVVTPKYDGGSIAVYYSNGSLLHAISRGNGTSGIDVTKNFKKIVPNELVDRSFTGMVS